MLVGIETEPTGHDTADSNEIPCSSDQLRNGKLPSESSFNNAQSSSEDPDDPNKILREAGENVSDDEWEVKERLNQEEEMLESFKKNVGESEQEACGKSHQFNVCVIISTLTTGQP